MEARRKGRGERRDEWHVERERERETCHETRERHVAPREKEPRTSETRERESERAHTRVRMARACPNTSIGDTHDTKRMRTDASRRGARVTIWSTGVCEQSQTLQRVSDG